MVLLQNWTNFVKSSLAFAGSPGCHCTRSQWSHPWAAGWPRRGAHHWVFNRWASENAKTSWYQDIAESEWWTGALSQVRAHCPLMIPIRKWWVRPKSLSPSPTNLMFPMRPMLKWMQGLSSSSKRKVTQIHCSVTKPSKVPDSKYWKQQVSFPERPWLMHFPKKIELEVTLSWQTHNV